MGDNARFFSWPGVDLTSYYAFLGMGMLLALWLTFRSKSKYKFELFFLCAYLITGNINDLLIIKIPGFSLFEIQPVRLLFFILLFLILRKTWLSPTPERIFYNNKAPGFILALGFYICFQVLSVLVNSGDLEMSDVLINIYDCAAFVVLMLGMTFLSDQPTYITIGKAIILGAVISAVISIIQFGYDPYFLRIGDTRGAFGGILRANGIFAREYFNAYYLIIAIAWSFILIRNSTLKFLLIGLFTIGVLTTFQRMSWVILILVLSGYFLFIKPARMERLSFAAVSIVSILLLIGVFFSRDIQNSSLVQDRLTDNVDGRKGYYGLVLDNIGKKPLFGYGGLKNEVYYTNMLQITGNRDRATATTGDLHSGYFSALFLYGIPACIAFILFVVLALIYYARMQKSHIYFAVPLFVSIIYLIGNLTNTFLFLKYIAILYALHIGIGLGMQRLLALRNLENTFRGYNRIS